MGQRCDLRGLFGGEEVMLKFVCQRCGWEVEHEDPKVIWDVRAVHELEHARRAGMAGKPDITLLLQKRLWDAVWDTVIHEKPELSKVQQLALTDEVVAEMNKITDEFLKERDERPRQADPERGR
jgi:hypothetical protein